MSRMSSTLLRPSRWTQPSLNVSCTTPGSPSSPVNGRQEPRLRTRRSSRRFARPVAVTTVRQITNGRENRYRRSRQSRASGDAVQLTILLSTPLSMRLGNPRIAPLTPISDECITCPQNRLDNRQGDTERTLKIAAKPIRREDSGNCDFPSYRVNPRHRLSPVVISGPRVGRNKSRFNSSGQTPPLGSGDRKSTRIPRVGTVMEPDPMQPPKKAQHPNASRARRGPSAMRPRFCACPNATSSG